jgi:hypothetical protein
VAQRTQRAEFLFSSSHSSLPAFKEPLVCHPDEGRICKLHKEKDCNQYHCSYLSFITPPTDPSFLGMTKQSNYFIADMLITMSRVLKARSVPQQAPLRGSWGLPSPTSWRGAGGEV